MLQQYPNELFLLKYGSKTFWLKPSSPGHFGFWRWNASFALWASSFPMSTFFRFLQLFQYLDVVIFKILNTLENSLIGSETFLKVTGLEKKEKKC